MAIIYLLAASGIIFVAVYMAARFALGLGNERWQAERSARRADLLRPAGADWKRVLLAVGGQIFRNINTLRPVAHYKATLRKDNVTAGYPWDLDEQEILALAELAFVTVTILVWILALSFTDSFSPFAGLGIGAIAGFAPGYYLGHLAVTRRIQINRALPFVLDLWVLTMESGSTFLESIETITESDPESALSMEFRHFLQAVNHGKTRRVALVDMGARVGSGDLSPVLDAINTGEDLGTPVGKTLRIQAERIRGIRTQRAEKLAAEAGSKMLFPSLLIMVAVLLMLMGPIIIKAVRGDLY